MNQFYIINSNNVIKSLDNKFKPLVEAYIKGQQFVLAAQEAAEHDESVRPAYLKLNATWIKVTNDMIRRNVFSSKQDYRTEWKFV